MLRPPWAPERRPFRPVQIRVRPLPHLAHHATSEYRAEAVPVAQHHSLRAARRTAAGLCAAARRLAPAVGAACGGTPASSSSRVDIRRLHVPQLPLEEQAGNAEVFRHLTSFGQLLKGADVLGEQLADDISDRLSAGGLTAGR